MFLIYVINKRTQKYLIIFFNINIKNIFYNFIFKKDNLYVLKLVIKMVMHFMIQAFKTSSNFKVNLRTLNYYFHF